MKCKVFVVRHGQTFYNKNKYFTGHTDSKLTPKGKKQAQLIGKKLKGQKFEYGFVSSLSRAKDTLKIILKGHKEYKKTFVDDRIIERDYGDLAGFKHKTIIEKFGEDQFEIWHRSYKICPPNGECFSDVEKRVKPFVKDLLDFLKKEQTNVIISAHGNSIRLFRKIVENLNIEQTKKLSIAQDKVYEYTFDISKKPKFLKLKQF